MALSSRCRNWVEVEIFADLMVRDSFRPDEQSLPPSHGCYVSSHLADLLLICKRRSATVVA